MFVVVMLLSGKVYDLELNLALEVATGPIILIEVSRSRFWMNVSVNSNVALHVMTHHLSSGET